MFSRNRKKTPGSTLVGCQIQDQGLSLAQISFDRMGQASLDHLCFVPMESKSDLNRVLKQTATNLKLESAPWSIVLTPGDYQLLLVDVPDVADDEVEDTLKFRVRDLISYSLDDAMVGVFRLPDNAYRGRMKMAYVAVAQRNPLEQITDLFGNAGLKLHSIDIADLAMRNLAILGSQHESSGVLMVQHDHSVINLCHKGYLCLNRRIDIGTESLLPSENEGEDNTLLQESLRIQLESLVLEIQRSFDYFESQLGLGSITELQVVVSDQLGSDVFDSLAQAFTTQVRRFRPQDHFKTDPDLVIDEIQNKSFALGAALRYLEVPA